LWMGDGRLRARLLIDTGTFASKYRMFGLSNRSITLYQV
jgi:hypothetical protein